MNIYEVIEYMNQKHQLGNQFRLENIQEMMKELGDPHKRLQVIHVAGTNGKGSVCASLYHMIMEAGYSVGFFSSPHLISYLERFRYNGKQIRESDFCAMMTKIKGAADAIVSRGFDQPTEFEILTALAYLFFDSQGLEYAIMEVGLGGRLDATNVIERPIASVITPLSIDHAEFLGSTIEEIAWEKAGIIKKNVPVITAVQPEAAMKVIQEVASELHAPLKVVGEGELLENTLDGIRLRYKDKEYDFSLPGTHQLGNAILAIETMEALRKNNRIDIDDEEIKKGLKNVVWPGRIERLSDAPPLYIDGAHNPAAAQALKEMLEGRKVVAVIGMLADKDVAGVLDILLPVFSQVIATRPQSERAISAEDLAEMIRQRGREAIVEPDIKQAVEKALSIVKDDEMVVATGSFYLIGEVRKIYHPSFGHI